MIIFFLLLPEIYIIFLRQDYECKGEVGWEKWARDRWRAQGQYGHEFPVIFFAVFEIWRI